MNVLIFLHDAIVRLGTWADLDFWEAMFACGGVLFIVVLYRLHRSATDDFRFTGFFTDDETGKASARKLFAFGAFLVHSWATARYCAYTKLDDQVIQLLALYGLLWAGLLMLGKVLDVLAEGVAAWLGARAPKAPAAP